MDKSDFIGGCLTNVKCPKINKDVVRSLIKIISDILGKVNKGRSLYLAKHSIAIVALLHMLLDGYASFKTCLAYMFCLQKTNMFSLKSLTINDILPNQLK